MPDQTKILVIDDEQIMRDGCVRILSKNGCVVIPAENGRAGLIEFNRTPDWIDIILLDLMMPGMNGMEVLERIRALDKTVIVIVTTGYATVEYAVEAMRKGAYDFIAKPFTPDQLRTVVKRAMERRRLQKKAEFLLGDPAPSHVPEVLESHLRGGNFIYYHQGHSWVMPENGNVVKVGADDFAWKLVGKIDAIQLPQAGSQVMQGEKAWSLRVGSKSIDMLSPVDGKILDINEGLLSSPESIGSDPYGESWLMKVEAPKISANLKNLLSGRLAGTWMEGVRENLVARMNYKLGVVSQDGGMLVDGIARILDGERWDEIVKEFFLVS